MMRQHNNTPKTRSHTARSLALAWCLAALTALASPPVQAQEVPEAVQAQLVETITEAAEAAVAEAIAEAEAAEALAEKQADQAKPDADPNAKKSDNKTGKKTSKKTSGQDAKTKDAKAKNAEAKDAEEAEKIRKQMRELQREMARAERKLRQKKGAKRQASRDAIKAKIEKITLPDNPTRAQCEAYIKELRKANANRRSYSSSDPTVRKLRQIPEAYYDLLVIEMGSSDSVVSFFAERALRKVDPAKLRKPVIEQFKKHGDKRLLRIIVKKGWVTDVRENVIKRIERDKSGALLRGQYWFLAAVELNDPKLFPKLHKVTVNSHQCMEYIAVLRTLPGYNLGHTAQVCWERAKQGDRLEIHGSSYTRLAAYMAGYGNVEALGVLIDNLVEDGGSYRRYRRYGYHGDIDTTRLKVLRFIEFRGTNPELKKWFQENKDKLVFDHFRKQFVVSEQKKEQKKEQGKEPKKEKAQ